MNSGNDSTSKFFKFLTFIFAVELVLIITKFCNVLPWEWHWVLMPFWLLGAMASFGGCLKWIGDR